MSDRSLVVISVGLRSPSSTRLLADRLAEASVAELTARDVSVDVRVVELREYAHDITNHLLTGFPAEGLRSVLDGLSAADGIIAVTPVFNASYSGLFKSFFDVVEEGSLVDKPVLMGATGGTARHSLVLEHALRPLFTYLRAVPTPTGVYASAEDWASEEESALRTRIARAARQFAGLVGHYQRPAVADPFALTQSFDELLSQ